MVLTQIAWVLIALETILFLVWLYSLYGPANGTDAAGRGLGQVFALALGAYIAIGIALMLFRARWSTIAVIVMSALPMLIVVIGFLKWISSRRRF